MVLQLPLSQSKDMKHDKTIYHLPSQDSVQVTAAIVHGSELERLDERWEVCNSYITSHQLKYTTETW